MKPPQCIVIVDDERSVRSGLSNLLQSEGYSTLVFDSAEALLAEDCLLAGAAFFIIDINLKGMSGFDLFIELTRRKDNPQVILISGQGDESMLWYAISLGALAFLRKPIDIDTLFGHIHKEFNSRDTPP